MSNNHKVHKYARVFLDKDIRKGLKPEDREIAYRCYIPNCTHYLRRKFVLGQKSICWHCDEEFIMGVREIRMSRPNCGCKRRSGILKRKIEEVDPSELSDILKLI